MRERAHPPDAINGGTAEMLFPHSIVRASFFEKAHKNA
jgi:hypothetical protein